MKRAGIYKITNPTGRVYIGQSNDVERRIKSYRIKGVVACQPALERSLNKYGYDAHKFDIIEICQPGDLNRRERWWQEYFNVLKDGLNCKLTGTKDKPTVHSEETKRKIAQAKRKGAYHACSHCGKMHWRCNAASERVKYCYCSAKCYCESETRARNEPVTKTCPTCLSDFTVPYGYRHREFCNRPCRDKFRGIEKDLRRAVKKLKLDPLLPFSYI